MRIVRSDFLVANIALKIVANSIRLLIAKLSLKIKNAEKTIISGESLGSKILRDSCMVG